MSEEVIIDLKLKGDDGSFGKLSQYKSSIVGLKDQQKELQKAYKAGDITLKEYTDEMVRNEAVVKKMSHEYSTLQKEVTGVQSPFDKMSASMEEQAKQINVLGVSWSTFLNPVTATIGVLGAVTKAYSMTTVGAKDLEHAQNQLGFAFKYTGNQIAKMLSGGGEGGEGAASKGANILTKAWASLIGLTPGAANELANMANKVATIKEQLNELHRTEIKVQADNKEREQDIQDLMTEFADGQKSYEERIHASNQAIILYRKNEEDLLTVKQKQLEAVTDLLATDEDDEAVQEQKLQLEAEIEGIKKNIARRVEGIKRAESNLLDTEVKKTQQAQRQLDIANEKERKAIQKSTERMTLDFKKSATKDLKENIDALDDSWVEHNKKLRNQDLIEMRGYAKEKQKISKESADIQAKHQEKISDYTVQLYANQVNVYQQMLQQSNDIGTALLKGFLINMLRMLKSALEARIIGESFATLDSILSFGISGAIRAAALVGLVEGAFSIAENFIMGFAGGGVVSGTKIKRSMGRATSRSNGDNVVITAKEDEVILNKQQQAALGGDKVFRAIGVPGFEPGFATGGHIGSVISREYANNTMMREFFSRLSNQQVAVIIDQVEVKLQKRALIKESAQL